MISVSVPATTANVGPGFDCLGIALTLYNTIEAEIMSEGLKIEVAGRDSQSIETDETNLVYRSMVRCFEAIGEFPSGLYLKQYNEIPISRGLGSSAACIVGGLVAANQLMGSPLTREALLELAVEMEGHPDNVAPALLGGVVTSVVDQGETHSIQFPVPEKLKFYAAIPDVELSTKMARASLPQTILRQDGVFNVGKAAFLVGVLMSGQLDKLPFALQDRLHQPYRLKLMPSLEKIFADAAQVQLHSIFLSGAGPTVMLLDWGEKGNLEKLQRILAPLPEKWEILQLKGHNEGI